MSRDLQNLHLIGVEGSTGKMTSFTLLQWASNVNALVREKYANFKRL